MGAAARRYGRAVIGDAASLAAAIGVAVAIYQLRLSWLQSRATFEQTFVDRFWAIEDDRLRGADQPEVNRLRYLRLCEDQFEPARLRQISRRTWTILSVSSCKCCFWRRNISSLSG